MGWSSSSGSARSRSRSPSRPAVAAASQDDPVAPATPSPRKECEELEVRAGISADDFLAVGSEVIAAVAAWVAETGEGLGWSPEEENHEGLRVRISEGDGREGWFLVRQSLHDPVLVINFESSEVEGLLRTVPLLAEFLTTRFPALDTAGLRVPKA